MQILWQACCKVIIEAVSIPSELIELCQLNERCVDAEVTTLVSILSSCKVDNINYHSVCISTLCHHLSYGLTQSFCIANVKATEPQAPNIPEICKLVFHHAIRINTTLYCV